MEEKQEKQNVTVHTGISLMDICKSAREWRGWEAGCEGVMKKKHFAQKRKLLMATLKPNDLL